MTPRLACLGVFAFRQVLASLTPCMRLLYCDSTFRHLVQMGSRAMPSQSYWSDLTSNRVTRRRALQATGAGVAGAAFLAACGGSDSSSGGSGKAAENKRSSIVTEPKDTAKEGKAGGVWKHFARGSHPLRLAGQRRFISSRSPASGYAKLLVGALPAGLDGGQRPRRRDLVLARTS